jgi:hypothetical protein
MCPSPYGAPLGLVSAENVQQIGRRSSVHMHCATRKVRGEIYGEAEDPHSTKGV